MMDGRKKQPELRFKGFSGDWEERKFREFGSVVMNKRIFKEQTSETGEIPFYKIGTFGGAPDAYITRELFEEYKRKYAYPKVGDILISASGSIGRTVEYMGADEYFQDSNIVWLEHDESLNNLFLKHFYSIVKWQGLEGSTIKRLYNKNILDTNISVPSINEQKIIGVFFTNLDNLITLQQRKFDKLTNIKKALLEKMFPKNGAVVPEIRFKGFSEDWEQRELGDLLQIKDSARIPNEKWVETGIRYLRSSDLENNGQDGALFISSEAYEAYKSKTGAPECGDVLFNSGGNIGLSLLKTDNAPIYVQGGAILYIRTSQSKDVDGSYLNIYFSTSRMKKYIDITSAGGTMKHFTLKPANAAPFIYPNIIEQKKIGEFFNHLDNLITLHQLKLEKLKNIKKACLEKMFV